MSDGGAFRLVGAGTFVNAAGATFDLQSDADFTIFNGANVFDNDGLLRKSGGAGLRRDHQPQAERDQEHEREDAEPDCDPQQGAVGEGGPDALGLAQREHPLLSDLLDPLG